MKTARSCPRDKHAEQRNGTTAQKQSHTNVHNRQSTRHKSNSVEEEEPFQQMVLDQLDNPGTKEKKKRKALTKVSYLIQKLTQKES